MFEVYKAQHLYCSHRHTHAHTHTHTTHARFEGCARALEAAGALESVFDVLAKRENGGCVKELKAIWSVVVTKEYSNYYYYYYYYYLWYIIYDLRLIYS